MLSTHRTVTRSRVSWSSRASCSRPVHRAAARPPRRRLRRPPPRRRRVGGRFGTCVRGPSAADMDALIAAAKAEGDLTTIALPHDWCNYGEVIDGVHGQVRHPDQRARPAGGSGDEIEAIKANKNNPGPQSPDVVDVGLRVRPAGEQGALPAVQGRDLGHDPGRRPRRRTVSWYGDYYGVMSFVINTEAVPNPPKDWADLLKPEYKNQVALDGDPRTSNQAIQAIWASGLANGGSLDNAQPGLDFWSNVVKAGNFVPVIANPATDRQRRHADRAPVVLQRTRPPRTRQPADRRRRSRRPGASVACTSRPSARRAPSQCRQAVDGAPLLGRRASSCG